MRLLSALYAFLQEHRRCGELGGAYARPSTRREHSPPSAMGTGWEPTPWRAMQRAAWEALK